MWTRHQAFIHGALLAVTLLFFAGAGQALAQEAGLTPAIPQGKGTECVADTDYMRRNHMNEILHQRDATMHEGIRTPQFSLNGCVECHAVNGVDGKPVSYESPQHFCRTCHDYAAVRIDCFECHNSKPSPASSAGLGGYDDESHRTALLDYLKEQTQ